MALDRQNAPADESLAEPHFLDALEDDGIVGAAHLGDSTVEGNLESDPSAALDFWELGHRAEHTAERVADGSILGPGRSGDQRSA